MKSLERRAEFSSQSGEFRPPREASSSRRRPKLEALSHEEWEERVREGKIFGRPGEVEFREDGSTIRCHLCGNWLQVLNYMHLRAHGLENGDKYKELLGLNATQPIASPNYCERRREESIARDAASNLKGKRTGAFIGGPDKRREGRRRLQFLLSKKEADDSRRERGVPPASRISERPEIRRVEGDGNFTLYQKPYFFSTRADQVEIISISPTEVVVTGMINGEEVTKTYKRKR